MSLMLDHGPHHVTIWLEETVTDSYGNTVKRPSTTPYELYARDAPLDWWARVVWHHPDGRDRRMTVMGGPLLHEASPGTRHVSCTLHEES